MAVMTTAIVQARYDAEYPGLYCPNHRSVYCADVQTWIENRDDVESLAEVIGGHMGDRFHVSFPVYPSHCIWEILVYEGSNHEMLGPLGELTGKIGPRHLMVQRIMPGESAADLAQSLRDNFESEVEDKIAEWRDPIRRREASPGVPAPLPRCVSPGHSMRYQRLINEMLNPRKLADYWDDLREQTYALMWTFHYHRQCLFCWTKSNMKDAIRVAPDFAVDPDIKTEPDNHSDLVPDASSTNKRRDTSHDRGDDTSAPW